MTTHGGTARIEIETLKTRIDELLDKLVDVVRERDLAQEKLSYAESEWSKCMEERGLAL